MQFFNIEVFLPLKNCSHMPNKAMKNTILLAKGSANAFPIIAAHIFKYSEEEG